MTPQEVWDYVSKIQTLEGRKQIEYTPKGQERRTYFVEGDHIYNAKGEEIYKDDNKDKRKILSKIAVSEGRAVVVKHKNDRSYVVFNDKSIVSATTGNKMEWKEENGDRRDILNLAEQKFRTKIDQIQHTLAMQVAQQIKDIHAPVHLRDEFEEYLKMHPIQNLQMAVDRFVDKYSLPKGELPALSSALMVKYGNKEDYGCVICTANYEYTVIYKGAGEFDIIEYHPIDNNINNKVYDKNRRSAGSYDRLSARDEIAQGERNSDSYNASEGRTDANYVGLDQETSQRESQQTQSNASGQEYQRGSTRLSKTGADGTVFPRVIEIPDVMQQFITLQGEVYGFVTPEGHIYLDETIMKSEHGIHEFTHLWDRIVASHNEYSKKLWKRGVELMKQLPTWKQVENDEQYGLKWKAMKGMTPEKHENLIASEVHSLIVGEKGQALSTQISQQKGYKGIIGKLKQWILDFWRAIAGKDTLGVWSDGRACQNSWLQG